VKSPPVVVRPGLCTPLPPFSRFFSFFGGILPSPFFGTLCFLPEKPLLCVSVASGFLFLESHSSLFYLRPLPKFFCVLHPTAFMRIPPLPFSVRSFSWSFLFSVAGSFSCRTLTSLFS